MECPHVPNSTTNSKFPSKIGPSYVACAVCKSVESPWLCLQCGVIHCGRYINGHAKAHYESHPNHSVSVDCYSGAAYCYLCDEFVVNVPDWVRDKLDFLLDTTDPVEENDENMVLDRTTEPITKVSSSQTGKRSSLRKSTEEKKADSLLLRSSTRKRSSGQEQQLLLSPGTVTDLTNHEPKKRKLDNHHQSPQILVTGVRKAKENVNSNGGVKHGVVGLRNLGNTCFMNAVLQSLSKIRGFSCYIAHIPPLEELRLNNNNHRRLPPQSDQTLPPPTKPRIVYSTRSRKREQSSFLSPTERSSEANGNEELLITELKKIVIMLNTTGSSAVSPDALLSLIWELMPRFRGYQQQDAHEFLRYMLDQLHTELVHLIPKFSWSDLNGLVAKILGPNQSKFLENDGGNGKTGRGNHGHRNAESFMSSFGYNSIVTSMFGGILENEVRCSRCGTESRKNDPFLDLSLDIPQGDDNGETRLQDCLSSFTGVEELSDSDKYYCATCKTHQKSTKRFSIQRLPNVLCLHLKRFRWANYLRTKLDHYVQFPISSLDMSEYLLDKLHTTTTRGSVSSNLYDLAAVIVHHGSGVGSGHYTAFAKKDGAWYHFNDSTVKPSHESAVSKSKAYILFYCRNEFKL